MTLSWKNAIVGTLVGTTIGLSTVTLVGYLVDGDEAFCFTQTIDGKQTVALVKSGRGGLFAHAHELIQVKPSETAYNPNRIRFSIKDALLHGHAKESDLYEICNDYKIHALKETEPGIYVHDVKSYDNISRIGGLHTHGLELIRYYIDGEQVARP